MPKWLLYLVYRTESNRVILVIVWEVPIQLSVKGQECRERTFFIGRMTKRGIPPPINIDKQGDTAFRRIRGFRCTCGRWHQSNGPAGCMRFHGTYTTLYIFTATVSEQPHAQRPVAQALSSPKSQTYVRVTYLICAPRACVSFKKNLIISRAY